MLSFNAANLKPDVEAPTGHQRTAAPRKADDFPVYPKENFLQSPTNCKNVAVNENKNRAADVSD